MKQNRKAATPIKGQQVLILFSSTFFELMTPQLRPQHGRVVEVPG